MYLRQCFVVEEKNFTYMIHPHFIKSLPFYKDQTVERLQYLWVSDPQLKTFADITETFLSQIDGKDLDNYTREEATRLYVTKIHTIFCEHKVVYNKTPYVPPRHRNRVSGSSKSKCYCIIKCKHQIDCTTWNKQPSQIN